MRCAGIIRGIARSCAFSIEASASQSVRAEAGRFISWLSSASVGRHWAERARTQQQVSDGVLPITKHTLRARRETGCPRVSRFWPCSGLQSSCLPAQTKKRNSWSSSQSRFRQNRYTLVNTSNLEAGRSTARALPHALRQQRRATC